MARQYKRSRTTTAELMADYVRHRDEELLQALVTAGAFVALADGRVKLAERDDLVNFIDRQELVPGISRCDIGDMFDSRVRELVSGDTFKKIADSLQPLAGLSLSSVVLRTAERVATADRHLGRTEIEALDVIRGVLANSTVRRPRVLKVGPL
jgi:tellurite resistance protein